MVKHESSRPDGVARECLRNRVASVCAPRARLRKGKVIDYSQKNGEKFGELGNNTYLCGVN